MLREIHCDRFRASPILFHEGLNVVLGDEKASNSIGKSTLLMIVDFAFGGSDLLGHNSDLVSELGHHDYYFVFEFGDTAVRYRRGTFEPEVVYRCDEEFDPEEALTLNQYTAFLKQAYGIELEHISWRDLVSLYLRIWGKDNLSVQKPLHVVQTEPARKAVDRLIKTFGRYDAINDLSTQVVTGEAQLEAMSAAVRREVIPRIGAREYSDNVVSITAVQRQLDDIRQELAKYATNLGDLVSRDVLDLKADRDRLTATRVDIAGKLKRTQANIADNRHIASKHFHGLVDLVETVREDRLAAIEEFHSSVAKALRAELQDAEKELTAQLAAVDQAIAEVDAKMAQAIRSVEEPAQLVDRVVGLATDLQRARQENAQYEEQEELRHSVGAARAELSALRRRVVGEIEGRLNDEMREVVSTFLEPDRKSPELRVSETNYRFDVFEDTGTGTAYLGVVVLDLAVFRVTQLPALAHDTLMFKNIENDAVARLVPVYAKLDKQSFIAIDEAAKYGVAAASLLQKHSVIQLGEHAVLYVKNWRRDAPAE